MGRSPLQLDMQNDRKVYYSYELQKMFNLPPKTMWLMAKLVGAKKDGGHFWTFNEEQVERIRGFISTK